MRASVPLYRTCTCVGDMTAVVARWWDDARVVPRWLLWVSLGRGFADSQDDFLLSYSTHKRLAFATCDLKLEPRE